MLENCIGCDLLKYKSDKVDYLEKEVETQSNIKNNSVEIIYNLKKENEELKAQIEKMKNMQNCKHNWETKDQCVLNNSSYCICDKWELSK